MNPEFEALLKELKENGRKTIPRKFVHVDFVNNYRTNYDTAKQRELKESIRVRGQEEAIWVKLGEDCLEVIDGFSRIKYMDEFGYSNIKVVLIDETKSEREIDELHYIGNLASRPDPVDEARGFQRYIEKHKCKPEEFAQRTGYHILRVKNRLELLKLEEEILRAIQQERITPSHGLLLAKFEDAKKRKEIFDQIMKGEYSLRETTEMLKEGDLTANLEEAYFDISECKNCQCYAGNVQTTLTNLGAKMQNICTNRARFMQKQNAFVESKINELKQQGFNVLTEDEFKKLAIKQEITPHIIKQIGQDNFKKIQDSNDFFLHFDRGRILTAKMYTKDAKGITSILHPKKSAETAIKKAVVEEKPEMSEAQKEKLRKQRLETRVTEYKKKFLISKSSELMRDMEVQRKALALYALVAKETGIENNIMSALGFEGNDFYRMKESMLEKFLSYSPQKLDELIITVSAITIKELDDKDLKMLADSVGVDLSKHFTIDKEFIELHTKDQMIELAEEIGLAKHLILQNIKEWQKGKNEEIVSMFTDKGFNLQIVPKIVTQV